MEEYIPLIVGIAVAIAIAVAKQLSKKLSVDPAKDSTENMPQSEWDPNNPFGEIFKSLSGDPKPKVRRVEHWLDADPQAIDTVSDREGVPMTFEEKVRQAQAPMPASEIVADEPMQVQRPIGESRTQVDFDLKKAVIYSEILKPKYDDNIL